MVLAYELGMALSHGELPVAEQPNLAARQLLQWFFSMFGATSKYLPGLALVVVLLFWHIAARHPWKIQWSPLAGMAGESILLALPLLILNEWIPQRALYARIPPGHQSTLDDLLLSIGAGIYEELVFRLILISLMTLVLIDIGRIKPAVGMALSVIISSLLFAGHHYEPIGADNWVASEFAFRAAAGAYLAAVYVLRGFGLAVGCHIVYDVIAFLL